VCVMIIVQRDSKLFQVVLALSSASSFASLLNSWKQQCNKNRNDCNHDKKFDQRESTTEPTVPFHCVGFPVGELAG